MVRNRGIATTGGRSASAENRTPIGEVNMVWGQSASVSQKLMRCRVVLQFIALCLVMAALFFSVR